MQHIFEVYSRWPFEPTGGEGSWLRDAQGVKYLDLYGGEAVISIGHGHPYFVEKVREQLELLPFYSNAVLFSIQEDLGKALAEASDCLEHRLFMVNNSAEANTNALKLASFDTGRDKIIAFKHAFHGSSGLSAAVSDYADWRAPVEKCLPVTTIPLNDIAALDAVLDEQVAAVILEGVQSKGGGWVPEPAFLQHLEKACKKVGAYLIMDETQSGFGRSGHFFAHQYAGITPELITVSNGMGNGFPVGGVLIHKSIAPKPDQLESAFGGNPMACAAALSVLEIIEAEELVQRSMALGLQWKDLLQQIPGVKAVRGLGLSINVQLEEDSGTVRQTLFGNHHILTGHSFDPDTIRLLPPLNIEVEDIHRFNDIFEKILRGHS